MQASLVLRNGLKRRCFSSVAAAAPKANNAFNQAPSFPKTEPDVPLQSITKELKALTEHIGQLLGSRNPLLDSLAKYYTKSEGKYVRPKLVLLMAQATSYMSTRTNRPQQHTSDTVDTSISPLSILSDHNPSFPFGKSKSAEELSATGILPTQRRLAEITELIHTASLLHDDVIDVSTERRSSPSANVAYGNKLTVLAGDFLLGRASVALARLRDPEVTELLATVIANLVEGEFMQVRNTAYDEVEPTWHEDVIVYYTQKTYLKSASLISKSCRAAALLGECSRDVVDSAYEFGRNLGLAFQIVDDMLDYTAADGDLGKPVGADLQLGMATAPFLFAWKTNPELGAILGRKFAENGDVERARDIVHQSDGIEQSRLLAQNYADKAQKAISHFPESKAKEGLLDMCYQVMNRKS